MFVSEADMNDCVEVARKLANKLNVDLLIGASGKLVVGAVTQGPLQRFRRPLPIIEFTSDVEVAGLPEGGYAE